LNTTIVREFKNLDII